MYLCLTLHVTYVLFKKKLHITFNYINNAFYRGYPYKKFCWFYMHTYIFYMSAYNSEYKCAKANKMYDLLLFAVCFDVLVLIYYMYWYALYAEIGQFQQILYSTRIRELCVFML